MNVIIFIVLFSILSNEAYSGNFNSDTITSIAETINKEIQNIINSVNSFLNKTQNVINESSTQLDLVLERG